MSELDFDWTDAGEPGDHADVLDGLATMAAKRGRYEDATALHVAAECIRSLAEECGRETAPGTSVQKNPG